VTVDDAAGGELGSEVHYVHYVEAARTRHGAAWTDSSKCDHVWDRWDCGACDSLYDYATGVCSCHALGF
jgi:hypothetical protein